MELKMAEINNNPIEECIYEDTPKKINEFSSIPILSSPNSKGKLAKPKISYDDILTSLNMKVNNGKLEFITKPGIPANTNATANKNITLPQNLHQRNNYIYNKYFGDYKEATDDDAPRRPLTKREYIQQLKDIQREKRRIYQIKPTKLFFPPINTYNEAFAENNEANTNKLFSLR